MGFIEMPPLHLAGVRVVVSVALLLPTRSGGALKNSRIRYSDFFDLGSALGRPTKSQRGCNLSSLSFLWCARHQAGQNSQNRTKKNGLESVF